MLNVRSHLIFASALLVAIPALAIPALATPPLAGSATDWIATAPGDWDAPTNWSSGVPNSSTDARFNNGGAAQITGGDAECNSLFLGVGSKASVQLIADSFTATTSIVLGEPTLGEGAFNQLGGTVQSPSLLVSTGTYNLAGGSLELDTCHISEIISPGALAVSGAATLDIAGDTEIGPGGILSINGGDITIGTSAADNLLVQGELSLFFSPTVSFQNLMFNGPFAGFTVSVSPLGVGTIQVAGGLTLAGRLSVSDLGSPDGRYDVISAGSISGAFDSFQLPPGWTSGVDGTTLWIEKGDGMPVEPATWTEIKRAF